jgi:putative NADH-flavin reductase
MALTVLVAGATGRFRPVAELLLERGHRVRAGTRDPRSSAAEELAALGAELVDFDFDDTASIEAAAHGVDAVFASGTAHRAGPEGEVRHGRNLADALSAARVGHVVYSSGAGADQRTGVPVFEGKRQVEEYLNALRLPATILAPVYLMENLFNPWNVPALAAGVFPSPVPARRAIQQVPIVDVAASPYTRWSIATISCASASSSRPIRWTASRRRASSRRSPGASSQCARSVREEACRFCSTGWIASASQSTLVRSAATIPTCRGTPSASGPSSRTGRY